MSKTKTKNTKVKEVKEEKRARTVKKASSDTSSLGYQIAPFIIIMAAFFIALCLFATSFTGWLGDKVKLIFAGLFSWGAYLIPFLLIARAFCFKKDVNAGRPYRYWILSLLFVIVFSAIVATAKSVVDSFNPIEHFLSATNEGSITTGSLFGGMIAAALTKTVGRIITFILLALLLFVLSAFTVSRSPVELVRFTVNKINAGTSIAKEKTKQAEEYIAKKNSERIERNKAMRAEAAEQAIPVPMPEPPSTVDIDEDEEDVSEENDDLIIGPASTADDTDTTLAAIFKRNKDAEVKKKFQDEEGLEPMEAETDIGNDEGLDAEVTEIPTGNGDNGEDEPEPEYVFPPVHLLAKPVPITEEMNSEYENTAKKLISTLASFSVQVSLLDIAKGPTVTRYELQPKVGVRVRSIKNLADDIALSLAAKGVRIEAPIPGKEAVGIEVPNKNTSIVSIRSLIESNAFANAASKLTTCLGVDVAGNPVYCDVAKMPHMMIAGTTGSGKSVCINSLLISILYKAKPNEVKLILIDPKKIELGVYNGISHLLVPVVSDPKNAAGALAWSVNEMERRFALIEETGVRDIKAYNAVALRDGNREVLPHIVIVIDELADLMMTARDTVESSIARIAQKARAAGMHLIIGTQRPSVDVITGLIKANVPSRIAFTTASQIDSRTIIDTVGAEKLIGKGDMLYAPIGSTNPVRVQGAFVSDSEIESVISFLKDNSAAEYDEEVIDSIEREAAKCEKPKKSGGDSEDDFDDGDDSLNSDAMLKPAIEIAIDSGSISTSMLQRKLKLGYARAARLIDKMEAIGVVSEFAGSKPRTVLISREKYLEMIANSEDID